MSSSSPIVGIDLGTTYSAIAVFQDGDVRFIENALGQTLTPSVVAVAPRTKLMIVGRTAKDQYVSDPASAVATFKRTMGTSRTYELGDKQVSPVDLSAYVLDALRADAEQALGQPLSRCVITVPAYFNDAQRFATKQAAEAAGFSVERVLNEPTAAAIAYGLHKGDVESRFLVFDLGGGTFDVCVMELFEGLLEVRSTSGEANLGGEDFTAALRDRVLKKADIDPLHAADADYDAYVLAYKRAELLKRKLSRWPMSEVVVPAFRGLSADDVTVEITAEEADEAYAPLLARLRGPCRAALRGAGVRPEDLDEIILAGGATRMPVIRKFIVDLFGREPKCDHDPDLIVARGAAIQAALCADDQAVGDIVVTDVASHSLGVETTRQLGNQLSNGHFTPVIHRGTTIPTSRTESFSTISDNQTRIDLRVYEGESRLVTGNFLLGNIAVKGIPKAPAGSEVLVTFTYDLNGILEVEATVVATGKKTAKMFKRDGSQMSRTDLRNAESRIRQLKQDPRDRPRYRDVLERANLLWKDVGEQERYALEMGIHNFEQALVSRTPKLMDEAYDVLVTVCERIDGGERW